MYVCEYMFELVCLPPSTINICMLVCMRTIPPPLYVCDFSSNHAVATVFLGLDAPDNQNAHTTETLLVPHTPLMIIQPTSRKLTIPSLSNTRPGDHLL